jgi:hypothetical protein
MTAVEKARAAKGPVEAMRMQERWASDLALGDDLTDSEARDLDQGIAVLQERFPDIGEYPGNAEEFAQSRGHGRGSRAKRGTIIHEGRRRPQAAKSTAKPASRARSKPNSSPRKVYLPSRSVRRSRRSTGRLDRAIRQTGIPATAGSGGSMVMAALGGTVGLSLLYLLVSSAEKPGTGAAALPTMIQSVTNGLGRFLSLGDVFPASSPHIGPVPGARPVKPRVRPRTLNRVEREAAAAGGAIPGEAGRGGLATGDLSNPATELAGPSTRRRTRPHRARRRR